MLEKPVIIVIALLNLLTNFYLQKLNCMRQRVVNYVVLRVKHDLHELDDQEHVRFFSSVTQNCYTER